MVCPEDAAIHIPEGLDFELAGPLLCAGITTYNSIRNMGVKPGSVVAVQGIGGLGHLAIQFARKLGYEVVAFSSGADKEPLAKQLGANHYIDGSTDAGYEKLKALRPKLIVVTGPHAGMAEKLVATLGVNGKLVVLAVIFEPLKVNSLQLLSNRQSVHGWASGDSRDSEDTLSFALNNDVKPMIEKFPLDKVQEAVEKMLSNKTRFRGVLTIQ
eukprot:gene4345-5072_t